MAYQTPITIKEIIQKIQKKKYVLPSIQREFVWQPYQIEQLFDSIMRDYPISTFLFWQIEREKLKDFQLYEFIKDFHEKIARHNKKADLSNDEGVTAILDGQQRLTSIYIGLRGSYSYKMPYYHWDSDHAFPKRKLYLNIIGKPEDESYEYDFRFLTEDEALRPNLQLLQGLVNTEKNDKHLVDFYNNMTSHEQQSFKNHHILPTENNFTIHDFVDFFEQRRSLLKNNLSNILGVDSQVHSQTFENGLIN